MRLLLKQGQSAVLVLLIMLIGSFGLWVGTPLLWLWVGSQIEGATSSVGTAIAAMFIGVIFQISVVGSLLAKLSDIYRAQRVAQGQSDPGHVVLEAVLVISAGVSVTAFVIWFFLFAGASPAPIGVQL